MYIFKVGWILIVNGFIIHQLGK